MDIVSRIKKFIEVSSITNSQFADTCLIPRPTVSQLLNGRNKKVSDEIISKIHAAYPNLSISWLLFNEGEMMLDSMPDKTSDAPTSEKSIFPDDSLDILKNENLRELSFWGENDVNNLENVDGAHSSDENNTNLSNSAEVHAERKVVNIIVFYSDNSFEYFKPVLK